MPHKYSLKKKDGLFNATHHTDSLILTQFDEDEPPRQSIQLTCGQITSFIHSFFFFLNNITWDILFKLSILFGKKNIFNIEFVFSI